MLVAIACQASAAAPAFLNYTNSLLLGGPSLDDARAVAAANDGSIYMAGSFSTSLSTPGGTINTAGSLDGYLLRINPAGSIAWGIGFGGVLLDRAEAIAVDGTNVYVGGFFANTASFPGTNLTAQAGNDAFIASFNTNGAFQWVRQIKGGGDEFVRAIAVTPAGLIKVTGFYTLGASWDTFSATGAGMFLLSVDSSGQLVTVQNATSDNSVQPGHITIASDGTVLVAGKFVGGTLGLTSVNLGNPDAFLAAFGSSGNYLWAKGGGGTNSDDSGGLITASDGSIIWATTFQGTATFINKSYTTATRASWLGRLNTAGALLSSNVIDGVTITASASGKKNIVHAIANFTANVTLGGIVFSANGGGAALITSYLLPYWELEGVSTLYSDQNVVILKASSTSDDGLALVGSGQQSITLDGINGATSTNQIPNALYVRLTPPDYKLTIAPQGANLLFTYPAYYYDATLQTNAALPGTWGDAPATVVTNMGSRSITVSTNSTRGFYRLKR